MNKNNTATKQFEYNDTIVDIKQQLSIEIVRDFLVSTPEKAIQLIEFFEKRKLSGNLTPTAIADYDNKIKTSEAVLEQMLNMTVDVYHVNVEASVDAKPEKQMSIPFVDTKKEQASGIEATKVEPKAHQKQDPSIPEANKAAKKQQWYDVRETISTLLKSGSYEDAFKYAMGTLGAANYIPKKQHVSAKVWKDTEIHNLLKDLNQEKTAKTVENEATVAENKERNAEQAPVQTAPAIKANADAASKGFITNELKEIDLLKNVIPNIFDVPNVISSDGVASNGLGYDETRRRIGAFKSFKSDFEAENKALSVLAEILYKRTLNAAILAEATGRTEEDLLASSHSVANLFFTGRKSFYTPESISEWVNQAIAGPIENNFAILKSKEGVKLFPERAASAIEDAKIVDETPINEPEERQPVTAAETENPLYKKCCILGLNSTMLQAELEAFTPAEQVEIFLDTAGDTKVEELALSSVAERIHQFFSTPKKQQECDSFMNLLNMFFEKRPYDRKYRKQWVDACKKQGAGVNHKNFLNPNVPETPKTEVKEEEKPAERVKETTTTVEETIHYVERKNIVGFFVGCIKKGTDMVTAIAKIEPQLMKDGKYVEVRQKTEDSQVTLKMENKEELEALMGIIWNEAQDIIAAEKPVAQAEQEIKSIVDITKKGFEWLNAKDKPTYAEFFKWACDNSLNKRLLGQKEGKEFKSERDVANFIRATFGKMLPMEIAQAAPVATTPTIEKPIKEVKTKDETPFKKTEEEIHADFIEAAPKFEKYSQAAKWLRDAYNTNGVLDDKGRALSLKAITDITKVYLEDIRPDLITRNTTEVTESGKIADTTNKPSVAIDKLANKTLTSAYELAKAIYEESAGNPDQALAFCNEVLPQLPESKDWNEAQIAMWFKTSIVDVVDNKPVAQTVAAEIALEKEPEMVISEDILVINTCKQKHDFKQAIGKIFQKLGDTPDVRSQLLATILTKKGPYTRQIGKMPAKEIHAMLNSIKNKVGSAQE